MIYETTTHPRLSVGQLWTCGSASHPTVTIVALDAFPGGLAVNVLLQHRVDDGDVLRALVPIDWQHLEPHLGRVIATGIDVSSHLASYEEWKLAAESGQAGIFTLSPAKILDVLRETVRSGAPS